VTTEDFIISLFCLVDDRMGKLPKRSDATLYPSELMTIGLLYALKGGFFRAFYRWLKRDFEYLFVELPDRTRIQRALRAHRDWGDRLLADPTFFTVIDTYGIELIHPMREGRSNQQVGKKGKSNRRWIVGIKLCWLLNDRGEVVAWDWNTANVHDQTFRPVAHQFDEETIVLSDFGFKKAGEAARNLKFCEHKTWSERMIIETLFSLVTRVCRLKHLAQRVEVYLETHLGFVSALFNLLLALNRMLEPEVPLDDRLLHIAQYAL
jgi:Transposase DDE domain